MTRNSSLLKAMSLDIVNRLILDQSDGTVDGVWNVKARNLAPTSQDTGKIANLFAVPAR